MIPRGAGFPAKHTERLRMSLVMRSWTAVVMAGALAACGSGSSTATDAAVATDVTSPTDTGSTTPTDTGGTTPTDAGTATDTGSTTPTDAGSMTDTGSTTPTDTGIAPGDAAPPSDAASGPPSVSGTLTDNGTAIVGATVAFVGVTPPVTTTTSATGDWTLPATPGQSVWVRATAAGYRTVQRGHTVPASAVTNFNFEVVSAANAAQMFMLLGTSEDTSKGILVVNFNTADTGTNAPGFSATISTTSGRPVAIGGGRPQVSNISTGGDNALIFTNVPPGSVTVTPVAAAGFTCALAPNAIAAQRVEAQVMTVVTFRCR